MDATYISSSCKRGVGLRWREVFHSGTIYKVNAVTVTLRGHSAT